MSEISISVDQNQFRCPACRDLLKEPVTIPCGHSFCKECINGCWEEADQTKGVYGCPQCKDTFTSRPVLHRNNMLAEVVDKLIKKTGLQAALGDAECDFCTGEKHKAVKSCLVCRTSFCEAHLKSRLDRPVCSPSPSESREELLKYFCHLTLDPNTAHHYLSLSEKNRVVKYTEKNKKHPKHPERFINWFQVLSKESVCGRSYWEVEWESDRGIAIAVSYKGIPRESDFNDAAFALNSQSWSLEYIHSSFSFWHDSFETDLKAPPSSRIGVYVDHSAGILSFYRVSETMTLLHRAHVAFDQPLYAGFGFYRCGGGESGPFLRLCDPE